jgi:hypothetical protein
MWLKPWLKAGDKEDAIRVANRALAAAKEIQNEESKTSALSGVAQAMAQAGNPSAAMQVLQNTFINSRLADRGTVFGVLKKRSRRASSN